MSHKVHYDQNATYRQAFRDNSAPFKPLCSAQNPLWATSNKEKVSCRYCQKLMFNDDLGD